MTERYPSKQKLKTIKEWDAVKDPFGLIDYIHKIWAYEDWGWSQKEKKVDLKKKVIEYNISTGGWSGNEDVIGALRENQWFWNFYWVQSRRGGHYIFEIPMAKRLSPPSGEGK